MTIGDFVRKEFRGVDATDRVSKLVSIYGLLKLKEVPNVDGLERSKTEGRFPRVYLSPVGLDRVPQSGPEVFDAVACVLEALEVRYDASVLTT